MKGSQMKKVISVLTAVLLASSVSMPAEAATSQAVTGVSAYYRADLGYMVGWTLPANKTGITGYTVTSSPGGKTCKVTNPSASLCTFTAASIGFTGSYTFSVASNGSTGVLAVSGVSNAVTPASIPLAPIVTSAVVASNTSIDVAWAPSPNVGGSPLYGYKLTYWKSDLVGNPINATKAEKLVTTTYTTLSGLSASTMYIINVASCNAYGCNSADSWSYTPTTPITSAVTSIVLPRIINGGSASTTCFDSILDANLGETTLGSCGSVVIDPATYPVVVPSATQIIQPVLATKFAQSASLVGFVSSYSLATWAPIGLSWFAYLNATTKSPVVGFTTAVNISSSTPTICAVVGAKIIFNSIGKCVISANVSGNNAFLTSNTATATLNVTK
jgi:hypothetical protein